MSRVVPTLLIAAALALCLSSQANAGIWTAIPSATTNEITAIEYQSAERFWFTTGSGEIFKRAPGGAFNQVESDPTVVFRDIEFQPAGNVGLAVGTNGGVYRSVDAGANWDPITITLASNATNPNDCDEPAPVPLGDADSVEFNSTGDRAWIVAGGSQITTSAGTTLTVGQGGSWIDANKSGTECDIDQDVDDLFPVPGSPGVYFVAKSFGGIWFTNNNLTSSATEKAADAGNGFQQTRRLAGDPGNPNRQWSVAPNGTGGSYYSRTENGWNSADGWAIANPDRRALSEGYDVDSAGGTVLAAGEGGMILHSIDGRNFFFDDADGLTEGWRAVSLADGANAAIGGTNGKLILTALANVVPDVTKPTGTISGPVEATAGQPATYVLNAADEGGSGINPASFAWTSAGLPNASGQNVQLTFPNAGFFTVKVTFADNAGNTGEATLSVTVAKGAPVSTALPIAFTGPGNTLAAKIVGKRIRVTMKGAITLPAGATAAACSGKVTLRIKKGRRTMANRKVSLKLRAGKCRFSKTVSLRRSKVGRTNTLRLTVSHPGNTVLKKGSKSFTLVIRR